MICSVLCAVALLISIYYLTHEKKMINVIGVKVTEIGGVIIGISSPKTHLRKKERKSTN